MGPFAVSPLERDRDWLRDEALVEIVRGRLEGLGPVTTEELARPLVMTTDEVSIPLAALELEGFAMRGRFTAGAGTDEWCERRLLSRIHHYTLKRLRAEVEPIAARDFLRFLLSWQHVTAETRMAGAKALDAIVAQLEGFEIAAGAWESEILPKRIAHYTPDLLDQLCLSGEVMWGRLSPHPAFENG